MNSIQQDQGATLFFQMLTRGGTACILGLVQAFRSQGLGDTVDSWIGNGEKLPVTANQVEQALGKQQVAGIALMLGMSPDLIPSKLAQWLPDAIHDLMPGECQIK